MTPLSARRYLPSARVNWNWFDFTGADAAGFLHRLTTANIHELENKSGTPVCFLNPQGKIRCSFVLWRLSPDIFGIELNSGQNEQWGKSLVETIDFYTFGDKVRLVAQPEWTCTWVFPEAASATATFSMKGEGAIHICSHGSQDYGREWWTVWGPREAAESWLSEHLSLGADISESELTAWRVEALSPSIDAEITTEANPLEIGLRRSIADNKGCYPGQEVIEKIISLGSPPRRLVLLQLGPDTVAKVGDSVFDQAGSESGKISSLASNGRALAIVRRTLAKENTEVKIGNHSSPTGARVVRVAPY